MNTKAKLDQLRESERRNAENVKFLRVQRLSNDIRVIMQPFKNGFLVAAQQYLPGCCYQWEVSPDGWRDTYWTVAATREGANREFESRVRQEQRYLEAWNAPRFD